MAVGPDIAIPIGLIVTEAVGRALNHDFDGVAMPEIRIEAGEQGRHGRTGDRGQRRGTGRSAMAGDGARGGFGLTLIRGLAMQLGGEAADIVARRRRHAGQS